MKTSITLLELILVVLLISIISSIFYFKIPNNKLDDLASRLELYLKQVRYKALIDDKKDKDDLLWHKKRWTFKIFRCTENGFYFVIYTDENKKGHPNESESLIDPLSKKRVYSTNSCEYNKKRSKYVLLTKEYGVNNIEISCNETSTIGQLSFGNDGRVYTKLSSKEDETYHFELNEPCFINIYSKDSSEVSLKIEPKTGYINKIK